MLPGPLEIIIFISIALLIFLITYTSAADTKQLDVTSDLNKKGYSLRYQNGVWNIYLGASRVHFSQDINNIKRWAVGANALSTVKRYVEKKGFVLESTSKGYIKTWVVYDKNRSQLFSDRDIGAIYIWCQGKPNTILGKDSLKLNKYELRIFELAAKNDYSLGRLNDMWALSPNDSNNEELYFHTIDEVQNWMSNLMGSAKTVTDIVKQSDKSFGFKKGEDLYVKSNKVKRGISASRKWNESKVIVFMRGSYEEFQRLTKQEAKRVSEAAVKISWLDGDERLHPATVAIRAFCTVLKHSNDVNELMATLEVVALMTQHYEYDDFQKQLKVIDRRLLTTGFKEAGEIAIERGITEDTTENPTNASNATLSEKSSELVSTMAQCVSKHSSNLKLFNNWSLGYINCVCTTIATEYSFSSEHQVDEFIISLYVDIFSSEENEAVEIFEEVLVLISSDDDEHIKGFEKAAEDIDNYDLIKDGPVGLIKYLEG